jgi:hypothetical protein
VPPLPIALPSKGDKYALAAGEKSRARDPG